MPVRNRNRIYVDTTKNPNEGVSVADVQMLCPVTIKRTVNGVVERRNSCDVGVLCGGKVGDIVPDNEGGQSWQISSRIDIAMWAKFRPIEYKSNGLNGLPVVKKITDAQRQDVYYGIINIPVWSTNGGNRKIGHMLNFWSGFNAGSPGDTSNVNNPWITTLKTNPLGVTSFTDTNEVPAEGRKGYWKMMLPISAFRLSDFVSSEDPYNKGYFRRAKPPIGNLTKTDLVVTAKGLLAVLFEKNEEGVSDGLTIKYEDLKCYGSTLGYNMYFGAAFCQLDASGQPTGLFYYVTQDTSMVSFQQMGSHVYLIFTNENIEGRYLVFPFLSRDALLPNTSQTGNSPVIIPSTAQTDEEPMGSYYKALTDTEKTGVFIALMQPQEVNISIKKAKVNINSFLIYSVAATQDRIISWRLELTNSEGNVQRFYDAEFTFFGSDGYTPLFTFTLSSQYIGSTAVLQGSRNILSSYTVSPSQVVSVRVIINVVQGTSDPIYFKEQTSSVTANSGVITDPTPTPTPD